MRLFLLLPQHSQSIKNTSTAPLRQFYNTTTRPHLIGRRTLFSLGALPWLVRGEYPLILCHCVCVNTVFLRSPLLTQPKDVATLPHFMWWEVLLCGCQSGLARSTESRPAGGVALLVATEKLYSNALISHQLVTFQAFLRPPFPSLPSSEQF